MSDLIRRQDAFEELKKEYNRKGAESGWEPGFGLKLAWIEKAINSVPEAKPDLPDINVGDMISRQDAIEVIKDCVIEDADVVRQEIEKLPSAQTEVIPHRNYKYLSDFWCACGWHLGKKYSVNYCAECGRKVKWDAWLNQEGDQS